MTKKRRASSDNLFESPIEHLSAEDVRGLFFSNVTDSTSRCCSFCKNSLKIGTNDKTTSSLRAHLISKHTREVLLKFPKPLNLEEPKTKMNKIFDPFANVRVTQQKYDKACLFRFIANAESYSSLQNQGRYIHSFIRSFFFTLFYSNPSLTIYNCL